MPMGSLPPFFDRWMSAWHARATGIKAVSFAAIGLVNSAVDLGVFSFAYYYLELPLIPANAMAWTVAVTGSYILNSLTTFARESGRELRLRTYVSFAASQAAGLVTNTATVFVASYFMPVLAGKIIAIGASFLVNFSLSHLVVFRERHGAGTSKPRETSLVWVSSAVVAILALFAIGVTLVTQRDLNSAGTDISSQSRSAPAK